MSYLLSKPIVLERSWSIRLILTVTEYLFISLILLKGEKPIIYHLTEAHLKVSFSYHFGIDKESIVRTTLDIVVGCNTGKLITTCHILKFTQISVYIW